MGWDHQVILGDDWEAKKMEMGTMLGLVGMFVLIAAAVGMFIHSGMRLEHQCSQAHYAQTYRFSLIMRVCPCVLPPACG
ncbi:hypothetical protein D3C86_2132340 [compost metagenome]